MDRDPDADLRALAEPQEVYVNRLVLDRIELVVTRNDPHLHAVHIKVVKRGQKSAGIDAPADLGLVECDGERGFAVAIDHAGHATFTAHRASGALADARAG